MQDKLLIITKIKKTINYVNNVLINYPKSEYILKNNISDSFYNLLELIYRANIHKDIFYMKESVIKIRMIEYYLKISLDKKIISFKKYENIGNYLLEINKMINSWIYMKRVNNIYDSILDIRVIQKIYNSRVKVNTKNKLKLEKFENNYVSNMIYIKKILKNKSYMPGKYNIFLIKEPKLRIIMSQNIIDKLINHVVSQYFLINIFESSLIEENVATRKSKGTKQGIILLKKYLNEVKNENFYVLKFDISKYFFNLDHEIIKKLLVNKIKDKDVLNILFSIIDSTDSNYVNKEINLLKKKEICRIANSNCKDKKRLIKEINELPNYKLGKRLPIGNMSSQFLAILYLNELDHFIKNELKIKYYIRYMDDGVLIHRNKEY